MASDAPTQARPLTDAHGRRISYLRISVTDRCDLRCRYCMSEKMQFLPRRSILSLEEIDAIAGAFVERGVRKIRLTGGEPLVRGGVIDLVRMLGRHLETGDLDELTMTTNATRLADHAEALVDAGIRRVNVSLDTRDPETFRYITRWGEIGRTLDGIAAAKAAGLRVKINMVGLKGLNDSEIVPMMRWCADEGHDLTLIETMPLGQIDDDRHDRYLPLDAVQRDLERRFTLVPLTERTGGPARYWNVGELGLKLGLITPLTNNFCAGCNRVRITVSGKIYMCLGHDDHLDLKSALREGGREALDRVLDRAMILKPLAHDFAIGAEDAEPAVSRHMSVTGG
ncbi:MAG: GTP 3',8-cyclase MoaA [Parasphingopyxis sp.]|uniref:GTP 3',8-cyclase MoaA n=1 Tax=Parasphingopyxis sp. TaxID=1920299 RepID=UPI003F9F4906